MVYGITPNFVICLIHLGEPKTNTDFIFFQLIQRPPFSLAGPRRARMAPADDGRRELGADLQVDEAADPREAQRPPLHLPAQVNTNQNINF